MAPNMVRQAVGRSPEGFTPQKRVERFSQNQWEYWEYYEHIDQLTKQLGKLSNMNLEVFRHDKEER